MKSSSIVKFGQVAVFGIWTGCLNPPVAGLNPHVEGNGSSPQNCTSNCEGFSIIDVPDDPPPPSSGNSGGENPVPPVNADSSPDAGVAQPSSGADGGENPVNPQEPPQSDANPAQRTDGGCPNNACPYQSPGSDSQQHEDDKADHEDHKTDASTDHVEGHCQH